jgi:hypothetical protein
LPGILVKRSDAPPRRMMRMIDSGATVAAIGAGDVVQGIVALYWKFHGLSGHEDDQRVSARWLPTRAEAP